MIERTKNINKTEAQGFTIIELLVVIVVIAILAAITMVSYSGITARANTSAAKDSAQSVITKVNVYQTDTGYWPKSYANAASATTSSGALDTTATSGIEKVGTAFATTAPTLPKKINFYACGTLNDTTPATTSAHFTGATDEKYITGIRVDYYDFSTKTVGTIKTGVTSGTTSLSTATIACILEP